MTKTVQDFLQQAQAHVTLVDAQDTEVLLLKGAKVLDVREPAEFTAGHLPGAINIPRGVLEFMIANHPEFVDNQAEILIYCKNGGRSTLAAFTLGQMGYAQVKMLSGGFDGWKGTVHKIEVDPAVYR